MARNNTDLLAICSANDITGCPLCRVLLLLPDVWHAVCKAGSYVQVFTLLHHKLITSGLSPGRNARSSVDGCIEEKDKHICHCCQFRSFCVPVAVSPRLLLKQSFGII